MKQKYKKLLFNAEYFYQNNLYIALIPLLGYGFYKNGILPYFHQDISFFEMFRPFLIPLAGLFAGMLVEFLFQKKQKEKENLPFYGFLIGMILPVQANFILTFLFLLFLFSMIKRKNIRKVSPLLFGCCFLLIFHSFILKTPFENESELAHQTIYSITDFFFGRSIGGVCNTNIFLSLLALLFLSMDYYYKKEIALSLLGSYLVTILLLNLVFPNDDLLKTILNAPTIFSAVFLATDMEYTPYMEKGKIMFGVVVGMLTPLFNRFIPSIGIYFVLFFISFFTNFFDNLAIQLEKNDNFCRNTKMKKEKLK